MPTIWSMSGPTHPPSKYGAGNVAKIEKVDVALRSRPRGAQRGVERIDRVVVDEVDQGGADEGADHLRDHVGPDLAPRELPADGERQRHRRVDVGTADAPAT